MRDGTIYVSLCPRILFLIIFLYYNITYINRNLMILKNVYYRYSITNNCLIESKHQLNY